MSSKWSLHEIRVRGKRSKWFWTCARCGFRSGEYTTKGAAAGDAIAHSHNCS